MRFWGALRARGRDLIIVARQRPFRQIKPAKRSLDPNANHRRRTFSDAIWYGMLPAAAMTGGPWFLFSPAAWAIAVGIVMAAAGVACFLWGAYQYRVARGVIVRAAQSADRP